MGHHIIEFDCKCESCKGTGLYVGMGERNGAAVVCSRCNGTGKNHRKIEYDDFEKRTRRKGVRRVYRTNPGICIGEKKGVYRLDDFGGIPYTDWLKGGGFAPGTEDRHHTCPAWFYQCADYDLKPEWDECLVCGTFSGCDHFSLKSLCWKRWDEENRVGQ